MPTSADAHERSISTPAQTYLLFLLFALFLLQTLDRGILQILLEPIKVELVLSDSQLGFLVGPAFALVFAVGGIPLGLLADRTSRKRLMILCLTAWSLLTSACGLAQSFAQLAVARMGVGIGEAGGAPASVSMIADAFPAERRARAVSVFYLGGSAGILVIFLGGSYVATRYGWRTTFMLAGSLGLILALAILATLREPSRGQSDGLSTTSSPARTRTTHDFIRSQRSIVHAMLGMMMFQVTGTAIMAFIASFLIRSHGYTLSEAGVLVALTYGVCNLLGIVCGGVAADLLARFDARWRTRVGLISALAAGAFLLVTMTA